MKFCAALVIASLAGCAGSPTEPLAIAAPTPGPTVAVTPAPTASAATPTPSPAMFSAWPVCSGSQPIWFLTNTGGTTSAPSTWSIMGGGVVALTGTLPATAPGGTFLIDHASTVLSGGAWTLVTGALKSQITCSGAPAPTPSQVPTATLVATPTPTLSATPCEPFLPCTPVATPTPTPARPGPGI